VWGRRSLGLWLSAALFATLSLTAATVGGTRSIARAAVVDETTTTLDAQPSPVLTTPSGVVVHIGDVVATLKRSENGQCYSSGDLGISASYPDGQTPKTPMDVSLSVDGSCVVRVAAITPTTDGGPPLSEGGKAVSPVESPSSLGTAPEKAQP